MSTGRRRRPPAKHLLRNLPAHRARRNAKQFSQSMKPACPEVVAELLKKVVERVRVDTHQASALAESALLIAYKLGGKEEIAHGLRARETRCTPVATVKEPYITTTKRCKSTSNSATRREAGRTISTLIQPLILMASTSARFNLRSAPGKSSLSWKIRGVSLASRLMSEIFFTVRTASKKHLPHYERAYAE